VGKSSFSLKNGGRTDVTEFGTTVLTNSAPHRKKAKQKTAMASRRAPKGTAL
jgi:hypothetical protein